MRVALLGCGLIGGSIGLGLGEVDEVEVIAAYDADPGRSEEAVAAGAAGAAVESIAAAVAHADLAIVAVPVSSIAPVALEAAAALPAGGIVTDVGSVKAPVVATVEAVLPAGVHFVGGHPMAGSEQEGMSAATPDLFRNAVWALTPTSRTDPDALQSVHRLVTLLGAFPLVLDPHRHDEAVAVISHVPQVAASSLMNVAARRAEDAPPVLRMAAGGFRDVTRIAAGSPGVWEDILTENAAAVREVLDLFIAEVAALRDTLGDRPALHARLLEAQRARRSLPSRPVPAEMFLVVVEVTDRPGMFAAVMTAAGEAGVNISDVELRHSPEGGSGLLTLVVAGAEAADTAVTAIRALGHRAHREEVPE